MSTEFPESLVSSAQSAMPQFLEYCCPLCKGSLSFLTEAYHCEACAKTYPVILGIPDFRVFDDPYLSLEEDRQKARRIAAQYDHADVKGLCEFYWSISPETPPELVKNYIRFDLAGVERGRQLLHTVQAEVPGFESGPQSRFLELGCRTGGVLVAASERYDQVIGIDIALRWLLVARKWLEQEGRQGQLVCCCAQYLPFREQVVDLVVAANVIEHSVEQEQLLRESHRVLRPGGALFALTCNRFSIAAEPHVRVWGVGWLPRKWMKPYVRWRRGVEYDNVRLVSLLELKRMLGQAGFSRSKINPPTLSKGEQQGLSAREQRIIGIYHRVKDRPGMRSLLLLFGPLLQVLCVREK